MTIARVKIKGTTVSDSQMTSALRRMHDTSFSKAKFAHCLVKHGLTAGRDGDFIRRLMQHFKPAGLIDFDAKAQT